MFRLNSRERNNTDSHDHYGHPSIAVETDLRLSIERDAQNSLLNSNNNPITFTNRVIIYPSQLESNRPLDLSLNQRLSKLEGREEQKVLEDTANMNSVENSLETQHTPHSFHRRHAWEDQPLGQTIYNRNFQNQMQMESTNFYNKSRTIVTKKRNTKFIKLTKNQGALNTNRHLLDDCDSVHQQESWEQNKEEKNPFGIQDYGQFSLNLNKFVNDAIYIQNQGNSFDKVEPFETVKKAKTLHSDSFHAKNQRMVSNAGLLENQYSNDFDEEERKQTESAIL